MNRPGIIKVVAIAVAVVLVLAVAVLILRSRMTEEAPPAPRPVVRLPVPEAPPTPPTATAQQPDVDTEETPPVVLAKPEQPLIAPPDALDGSDAAVKKVIAELAPAMLEWLATEQQIRKWVLSVDLMADGNVPKQYRPLSFPVARFAVDVKGTPDNEEYFFSADNVHRTDKLVTIVTAMDAKHVADYYQTWLPLLEKAYREQGKSDRFDRRFRKALKRMIAVKPLGITPALVKKGGVLYAYADSQLESASDVEKMMWRLGADNSAKLQAWLQQVLDALPAPVPKAAPAQSPAAPAAAPGNKS